MLVVTLIILMIMFVMGMTLLSIKNVQARSSLMMRYGKVAKYIAMAGMENARVKLLKDIDFPPIDIVENQCFTYSEEVRYPGDSAAVGYFVVTVDVSRNDPKNDLFDRTIRVTSVGTAKEADGTVLSSYRISALMDAAVESRSGTGLNPSRFQFIEWQDYGAM
jgi:hypothetical protein